MTYPQTILLRPSMRKWLLLMLMTAAFTAVGLWMISGGVVIGWMGAIFFGACFLVGVVSLLPKAARLVVMRDGFGIRALIRTRFYCWRDVDGFGVYELRNHHGSTVAKQVGFNAYGKHNRRGAALSVALVGFTHGLADTYGMSADELAAAMNAYR